MNLPDTDPPMTHVDDNHFMRRVETLMAAAYTAREEARLNAEMISELHLQDQAYKLIEHGYQL